MAYHEVFQRIEKKYRLSAQQRSALERALSDAQMRPDAYGRTTVTSVYLDTPRYEVIQRSLDRPLYKEKLRLRVYGEAAGERLVGAFASAEVVPANAECSDAVGCAGGVLDVGVPRVPGAGVPSAPNEASGGAAACSDGEVPVLFELKKKYRGVVYKRRVALSLAAVRAYLGGAPLEDARAAHVLPAAGEGDASQAQSAQILREIDAAFVRVPELAPRMAISCARTAWAAGCDDGTDAPRPRAANALDDLRITFDDTLRYCVLDAVGGAHAACCWRPIIGADESIMEVKSPAALPLWLADALGAAQAFPQTFSKYGTAYRLMLREGCPDGRVKGDHCA